MHKGQSDGGKNKFLLAPTIRMCVRVKYTQPIMAQSEVTLTRRYLAMTLLVIISIHTMITTPQGRAIEASDTHVTGSKCWMRARVSRALLN